MARSMIINAIKNSPDWNEGEYQTQPFGLNFAIETVIWLAFSPRQLQKRYPTESQAVAFLDDIVKTLRTQYDANDMMFQWASAHNYNPEPDLGKIVAPVLAINSADDQILPPELRIMEDKIKLVKNGRFVLLPISDLTEGHVTHTLPDNWKQYLEELLKHTERR